VICKLETFRIAEPLLNRQHGQQQPTCRNPPSALSPKKSWHKNNTW